MAAEAKSLGTWSPRRRYLVSGAFVVLVAARLMSLAHPARPEANVTPLDMELFAPDGAFATPAPLAARSAVDTAYASAVDAMKHKTRIARAITVATPQLNNGDAITAAARQSSVQSNGPAQVALELPVSELIISHHDGSVVHHLHHAVGQHLTLEREPNLAFESAFLAAGTPDENTFTSTGAAHTALAPIPDAGRGTAYVSSENTLGRIDGVRGGTGAGHLGEVTVKTEALVQHFEPIVPSENHSKYDALNLQTSVTVPAFRHPVHISIGGGYERLTQANDGHSVTAADPSGPDGLQSITSVTGTSNSAVLTDSNRLNVSRAGYSAAASVPISHRLNVGVGYSQRDVRGDSGFVQSAPVDQRQQSYTGSVTYAPRGGRSSISLVGESARAVDATTATIDSSVKRGDLLFSVKF